MATEIPDGAYTDREKTARLRLIRAEGVGPITFHHLIARYGSADAALADIDALATKAGRKKPLKVPSAASLRAEVAAVQDYGGGFLFHGDDGYPERLAQVDDAPPVLQVMGHPTLTNRRTIAVVGARNASASGRKLAHDLAASLSAAGVVIVSGLARGIDTASHAASLQGGTIACIAGGLDVFYPKDNQSLQQDIAHLGLLMTEMPLGTQPQARHFPRRNRLISGLSQGIVVVEAAAKSGSLITARMALEQGREVFAVPGSPLDPRSAGANSLIQSGAQLIQSADDIITVLNDMDGRRVQAPPRPATFPPPTKGDIDAALVTRLAVLLSPTPTDIDQLIRASGADAAEIQAAILALELAGRAERLPGGKVAAKPSDD